MPVCTPPRRRISHRGLFARYRRNKLVEPTVDLTTSPPINGCCFPRKRKTGRPAVKSVRFAKKPSPPANEVHEASSTEPSVTNLSTPRVMRKRTLSSKGLKLKKTSSAIRRSTSRRSFYSAVSSDSKWETTQCPTSSGGSSPEISSEAVCICSEPSHSIFDKSMPLVTGPGIEPGSYEELLCHAESILGNWVTLLDRSDTLDPQMVYVGIGKMKRMVMNRLAIPFTAVLECENTLLHCWISTPAGAKHTRSSLIGKQTEDKDSDLGDWTAETSIVNYSIKWFCNGKTVRAMQMKRLNPKLGIAYETRVALPDPNEGRILLYNITIIPPKETQKETIHVDRIYKFVSS